MREPDVVVVGGGPAGMGAALAAAESGSSVVLVDEHARPAGQYFKGLEGPGRDARRIAFLRSELARLRVEVLANALVWGSFDGDVMVVHAGASEVVRAKAIVLAAGAYDRPVPFPGWTLPGVMTAGAAQTFVKEQHVLPGRRVLLAGAGPFLLPVARGLAEAGAEVTLLEATPRSAWAGLGPAALAVPELIRDAFAYERALRRLGVRRRFGHRIVRADGDGRVESAVVAAVDRDWRTVPGSERTLTVDAVAIGYGFLPSLELADACGCDLRWDGASQTWFVAVDGRMATSAPGVYAAGEITGIAGNVVAFWEGRLAGASAVGNDRLAAQARRKLGARRRFARALDDVFRPRPGLWDGLEDDVVVCRCEEVRAGEIRERVRNGCTSPKAVKDWTRAGMGLCQGRICGANVARLIAEGTGKPVEAVPRASIRPPIKPVPVEVLAAGELP
jgi:NADPH-dependent 2,4-dienoyl-CoA reductase/sulfur reductase-like enzyme